MEKKKHEIRRKYDETADIYDQRYEKIQLQKYIEVFEKIDITDSHIILDLGGGTGLLEQFLGVNATKIFNCDLSFRMLQIGKKKQKNSSFILADSELLPFKEEAFETITSFSMIQNVETPTQVVKQCKKVLKSGGVMIFTALKKKFNPDEIQKVFLKEEMSIELFWSLSIEDYAIIAKKKKSSKVC
ncbi:MAG: class I SAM-dependent methyltransferase [Candidatus Heimdallarchaeaceae archaeon]